MNTYLGSRVFEGYALGKVVVRLDKETTTKKEFTTPVKEYARFEIARKKAIESLDKLYQDTLTRLGENEAQLFLTHKLMAEDLDFEDLVKEGCNELIAEEAVKNASETLASMFESMDDSYMKERSKDAREVGTTIINILEGKTNSFELSEPSILICNDLGASDLMKYDTKMLIGLVLVKGSSSSHVSILARMLEIPTIFGIEDLVVDNSLKDQFAILDANKGELIFKADYKTVTKYNKIRDDYLVQKEALKLFVGKKTLTKDGHHTKIYSNIASSMEAENAIKNDAEGIGLFRSEFIYLDSSTYPTEEEQFVHYKKVVEEMAPKEVIIRTLDIGADKKVDYFDLPDEENPALGYRSIRICKDRPELFLTQITALYRASHYGNLAVMIPMIISLSEIQFVKEIASLARQNLKLRGIPFNEKMKFGIMIETPAAAMCADIFAKNVDFFSIGTNDLTQYLLAIDRVNPLLAKSFNPHHRAILRAIEMTARAAHENNIPVGICGELAREEKLLPFFLKIGIDELSVSPAYVLKLRKQISEIDTSEVDVDSFIN